MDLSGTITEVEYYGINGLGKEGENPEYSLNPEDEKYYGALDFFCMFDGKTRNDISNGAPIGLTAFVNGSGGRWTSHSPKNRHTRRAARPPGHGCPGAGGRGHDRGEFKQDIRGENKDLYCKRGH
ncbi:MAG TPA: hypothetical protein GXZ53_01575 [Firmicutes bacterium]|nr:hypothetical protein [Bacillota bacterium]